MGASLLTEAELHGLVDGYLVSDRRAEVLRRAAASSFDRARIDAWQDQNDLIRSAFVGIEREPLPVALDLRAPPRLVCVPARDEPIVAAPARAVGLGRGAFGLATLLVVVAGLSACWMMVRLGDRTPSSPALALRGAIGPTLAERTAAALGTTVVAAVPAPLPTSTIPDLAPAGFTFTGAETQASSPASLVFHYRNAAAEHVVVGVARAERAPSPPSEPVANTLSWQRGGHAYAIAGTLKPERLQAIAVSLQRDGAPD